MLKVLSLSIRISYTIGGLLLAIAIAIAVAVGVGGAEC